MAEKASDHPLPDTRPFDRLIRQTRSWLRLSPAATGLGLTVGLGIGILAAVALTDLMMPLWPALRLVGLLLTVVPTAWVLVRRVMVPAFRWLSPGTVARHIEAHLPGIHNRLVSCVDLAQGGVPPAYSPAFHRRLVHEALERVQDFRPRTVIDWHRLRRAGLFALVSVAAFALALTVFANRLPTALARIFFPFADIPPVSGVVFTVTPGDDAKVLRGEDVIFAVAVERGEANEFQLELRGDGAGKPVWQPLKKVGGNLWRIALNSSNIKEGFERSFRFRVHGGGTWSRERRVAIVDRPSIASLRTILHYPEYVDLPKPKLGAPQTADVSGPEGSRVEVVVQAEGAVKEGEIQLVGPDLRTVATVAMRGGEGNLWSGSFPLQTTGLYRIELRNELGYANKPMKEGRYLALPDQPPQVALERPGIDLTVSAPVKVPLMIAAFDDFGLADVSLEVRRGDSGPWESRVLKKYPQPQRGDNLVTALDLASFELKMDATVRYRAVARDRKGQTTRTQDFAIRLVADPNAADRQLAAFEKGQTPAREKLLRLIAEHAKFCAAMSELAVKYAAFATRNSSNTESLDLKIQKMLGELRQELAPLARLEQRNAELGEEIASDLAKTAEEAQKLSMLPPEIAREWQALRQAFHQRALLPLQVLAQAMHYGADPKHNAPAVKRLEEDAGRVQRELEAIARRMKALEDAQGRMREDLQDALTDLKREMLQQHGALTARDLEDLRNYIHALRKELNRQQGRQENLLEAAGTTPDAKLPELEKKQAVVDKEAGEALTKTRELQASEKMKRLKRQFGLPPSPEDSETEGKTARPGESDSGDSKKGQNEGTKEKGEREEADKEETKFKPALGGPSPKIEPPVDQKRRPAPKKEGAKSVPDRREELQSRQEENLKDLDQASESLAVDEQTLEEVLRKLHGALAPRGAERPQPPGPPRPGQPEAPPDLQQTLQSQTVQKATAMAARMRGQRQSSSPFQPGGPPSDPTTGNLQGSPMTGTPLTGELDKFDPATHAAILKLQPQLREELLQSMRERGPEGYQEFIDDYFKRLSQREKGK